MRKLYEKNEIWFALAWISTYVIAMNIGLQFSDGLDDLAEKTIGQVMVLLAITLIMAAASTAWIVRSGLMEKYGMCGFRSSWKGFLWFIPLAMISCVNLVNGVGLNAPLAQTLLMMLNKAGAGYVEEVIFRGFLFRAMAKKNLRSAIIVSAMTFGAGHIVNLANTADTFGVLLQVGYAIVIGFLYTVIVYRGGSLWPCIVSHMLINGSSLFGLAAGPFTELTAAIFGQAEEETVRAFSAGLLMLISGAYALWIWLRTKDIEVKA